MTSFSCFSIYEDVQSTSEVAVAVPDDQRIRVINRLNSSFNVRPPLQSFPCTPSSPKRRRLNTSQPKPRGRKPKQIEFPLTHTPENALPSSSPGLPQSSPSLGRPMPNLLKRPAHPFRASSPFYHSSDPLAKPPSPVTPVLVTPVKRKRGRPKKSEQIRGITKGITGVENTKKRKTAQEMETAKHVRMMETAKEKQHRQHEDKSFRHARQCARAIQKGDTPPPSLSQVPHIESSSVVKDQPPQRILYQICDSCQLPKATGQFLPLGINDGYQGWCLHCLTDSHNSSDETRWCRMGSHEDLRSAFVFEGHERSDCNHCAKRAGVLFSADLLTESSPLEDLAVAPEHWKLIEKFYQKLDELKRTTCDVCKEVDFDMQLRPWDNHNECARCRADRKKNPDLMPLRGEANDMDPGPVPSHLPSLSIAEEMLIARAHVYMDFRRVKGCQYKYSGHVVNFMQNTAKIVHKLPSLPSKLQVLILKPASFTADESAAHREFEKSFRVRCSNVEIWLKYLVIHHPDYQDITIDAEQLSQLPEDESILQQMPVAVDPDTEQNEGIIDHEKDDEEEDTTGM